MRNAHGANSMPIKDRTRVHYRRFHNIYLYITERCQLRCGHCYMGDRLERGLVMPYEKASHIISYCHRLGGEYITFLGGEPTLHPDLPKMVDYAREVGYTQVMINSNGLLERTIDRIAPEKLHYISFSLNGATQQTHDRVRGGGAFEKTIGCMHKTIRAGYPVRVICTISQINIHEAQALLSLADDLGVNITSIWYPPTYATRHKLQRYFVEGYRGCVGCSLDRLSIFPDGRCYVCSILFDVPLHFGILTDEGLTLNRERNEFELFTRAIRDAEEPWLSGSPAEAVLARQGKKQTPDHLISVCRLWKSQA